MNFLTSRLHFAQPLQYYLFASMKTAPKEWTLRILAINEKDAREYVYGWHHSGRLVNTYELMNPPSASCGAQTDKATKVWSDAFWAWVDG